MVGDDGQQYNHFCLVAQVDSTGPPPGSMVVASYLPTACKIMVRAGSMIRRKEKTRISSGE